MVSKSCSTLGPVCGRKGAISPGQSETFARRERAKAGNFARALTQHDPERSASSLGFSRRHCVSCSLLRVSAHSSGQKVLTLEGIYQLQASDEERWLLIGDIANILLCSRIDIEVFVPAMILQGLIRTIILEVIAGNSIASSVWAPKHLCYNVTPSTLICYGASSWIKCTWIISSAGHSAINKPLETSGNTGFLLIVE
jgi:hypothetical protein